MSELAGRVRDRLAGPGAVAGAVDDAVVEAAVVEQADVIVDSAVLSTLRREVRDELDGAGPLEPLLALPGVTDVLVNGPAEVWFDRGRGLERSAVVFADDAAVRRLAQRLAVAAGRRLDDAMPFVDATLADGTRLHAVLPPLCSATTVSLRVLARRRLGLDDLVAGAAMPADGAALLRAVVSARLALVITGGTGTGKTTLLGALLAEVSAGERLLVIEDAAEIVLRHPHAVRLVARTANVEGAGGIGLRELVRQALRMRPDRIVVGEFRGAEMLDLVVALNTGHEGGAATLHANSAADVPARFTALGALAGLSEPSVVGLVAAALHVVVHLERGPHGRRRLAEVGVVRRCGDRLEVVRAWPPGAGAAGAAGAVVTPVAPGAALLRQLLQDRGVPAPAALGAG